MVVSTISLCYPVNRNVIYRLVSVSDEAFTVCFRCIWLLSAVSQTAAGSSCLQVNINRCEKKKTPMDVFGESAFFFFFNKCLYFMQDLILTLLMTLEGPVYMLQLLEGESTVVC